MDLEWAMNESRKASMNISDKKEKNTQNLCQNDPREQKILAIKRFFFQTQFSHSTFKFE